MLQKLRELGASLRGDLFTDSTQRILYSTDASAYKEMPLAVARPRDAEDIRKIISFCNRYGTSLIPRTAGTSLAGQVVGPGIVVDVSRYMHSILELNVNEKWVKVQPGVVLDELNQVLEPHGLFFGPETSTSSRCMIGGMVGNNSCGSHSLLYGSTRDHTLAIRALLSDGSEVEFAALSAEEFEQKCRHEGLEAALYRQMRDILGNPVNQMEIRSQFPDPRLHRRNTGYAIDLLLETAPFLNPEAPFNFCGLMCGSEGTLAFITEITLNLVPLPPRVKGVMAVHFETLDEALRGNLIGLAHAPGAIELMDRIILECTRDSLAQRKNRFFIEGDPGALLIIEFARDTRQEIEEIARALEQDFRDAGLGYHFPLIFGADIKKVWDLRKAGLGVLTNVPGDKRSTTVIEDTAVLPEVLPDYCRHFNDILEKHQTSCVFYAHVGTGELHLRPMLNLKDPRDVRIFEALGRDVAHLVKHFKGSLSGEHGDGRLRGEFIPLMIGERNYALLKEIKKQWDPKGIFNPGKITDTPPMNSFLKFKPGEDNPEPETVLDFSREKGILRAAEKCTGSGDCRKTEKIGGTMCPSFMATRDEKDSTRARANILQEFLANPGKTNPFDHPEIYEVMDLCLACKACKAECPSGVDVAKLKAEFLQHWYDEHGIPLRTRVIAYLPVLNRFAALAPGIANWFMQSQGMGQIIKRILGISPFRSLPRLSRQRLRAWRTENPSNVKADKPVILFCDEFTDLNDTHIGVSALRLLERLGYQVRLVPHADSGRTYISKGLLRTARRIAETNVRTLSPFARSGIPIIGLEPSAILGFRDEYPDLVSKDLKAEAEFLAGHTFLFEEFVVKEFEKGSISAEQFTSEPLQILLHGHCQQKAVASTASTLRMLQIPRQFTVTEIPSGCCGMAGSFGYEKEHYQVSMQVGELVLFPAIRSASPEALICAPGTSCRHQIQDGTRRDAFHPAEIMFKALLNT